MKPLLAFLAAVAALAAWLNVRDLIGLLRRGSSAADPTRRSTPEQPDPLDTVQPVDPVTVLGFDARLPIRSGTWYPETDGLGEWLPQPRVLTTADIEDMPGVNALHERALADFISDLPGLRDYWPLSTQTGPLGPTA